MEPRAAASQGSDPEAVEFIRFCYKRRGVGWPELYDEMCAVAARGLYRGYGSDDLAQFGIGFSLFEMPSLAAMSALVVAEEQARRRPVSVTIRAEVSDSVEPAAAGAEGAGPVGPVTPVEEIVVEVPIAPPSIMVPVRAQAVPVMEAEAERVAPTVRLTLAPTQA